MEKLYGEKFIEEVRKQIIENRFNSKEELITYLNNLPSSTNNTQEGIENNIEDLSSIKDSLCEYYDLSKQDLTELNMDNISEVKVEDGKQFLKVEDSVGDVSYINIDNLNGKSASEILKDRQEELIEKTNNKDELVEQLVNTNTVIEMGDIKESLPSADLNDDRKKQVAAVLNTDAYKDSMGLGSADSVKVSDIIGSPEDNIYYDKKNDKTFYATQTSNGYEVKEANETSAVASFQTTNTVDINGNIVTSNSVDFSQAEEKVIDEDELKKINGYEQFNSLSANELRCALEHSEMLTDDQKNLVEYLADKKEKEETEENKKEEEKEKEQVKQLVLNNNMNNTTGFTSIIFIMMMVSINGLLILGYILFNVLLGK